MWGHCCCWFAGGFGKLWVRIFWDNNKQIIICYSGGSKTRMLRRMWTVKARPVRFQRMSCLSSPFLFHSDKEPSAFCPHEENWSKDESQRLGLNCLAEEVSRQCSIRAVECRGLCLVRLSESSERKWGRTIWKKRQPEQEWRLGIFKVRWDWCLQGADN